MRILLGACHNFSSIASVIDCDGTVGYDRELLVKSTNLFATTTIVTCVQTCADGVSASR